MRIDIHHHLYPPNFTRRYIQRLVADAPAFPAEMYLNWQPETSLQILEKHNIARAILSITSPGVWFGNDQEAVSNSRECNEYGAHVIAEHPDRFGMFAAIPLPDVDASLREIEYALDVLKLDGIGLMTSYGGKLFASAAFNPVFEELDRRHALVFVHPLENGGSRIENPFITSPILEFPFDTTRAIASVLLSGTLARFSNIRFIFCHGGGTFPFVVGRIEAAVKHSYSDEQRAVICPNGLSAALGNVYFDVVSATNRGAWPSLRCMADSDHLLFGTDSPFIPALATLGGLNDLALSDDERKRIESVNAEKLLGRARS